MKNILLQAGSFLAIILVAYFCKKRNYLKKADGLVLSKIIMGITLPATIVVSLAPMTIQSVTFYLIGIGFCLNFFLVLLGAFISRKQTPLNKAFMMYSITGYNVGNFTLPFFQGLLPAAIPYLCMFDIGNAIMLAGGTTSLVDSLSGIRDSRPAVSEILKKLALSIPFVTYLIVLLLRFNAVTIPTEALNFFQLFANANGFLSLFMVGLYLELRLPKVALKKISRILIWRYSLGIFFAVLFYFFSPFPKLLTLTLMLLAICPVPTFAVINSVEIGVPPEEAGFLSSASILLSLGLMTAILLVFL